MLVYRTPSEQIKVLPCNFFSSFEYVKSLPKAILRAYTYFLLHRNYSKIFMLMKSLIPHNMSV